jgi:hypothetical protein
VQQALVVLPITAAQLLLATTSRACFPSNSACFAFLLF